MVAVAAGVSKNCEIFRWRERDSGLACDGEGGGGGRRERGSCSGGGEEKGEEKGRRKVYLLGLSLKSAQVASVTSDSRLAIVVSNS